MKRESKAFREPDFYYRPHHIDDAEAFRQNYDRIFRKGSADPAAALVPGTVRENMSDCCCEPVSWDTDGYVCNACFKVCNPSLTKINP